MDILIDINFNAKPEGLLKLLRAIEDLDLFWVEIDRTTRRHWPMCASTARIRSAPARR